MSINCSKCSAKKLDIWFDGPKGEVLCGKCFVGGNSD